MYFENLMVRMQSQCSFHSNRGEDSWARVPTQTWGDPYYSNCCHARSFWPGNRWAATVEPTWFCSRGLHGPTPCGVCPRLVAYMYDRMGGSWNTANSLAGAVLLSHIDRGCRVYNAIEYCCWICLNKPRSIIDIDDDIFIGRHTQTTSTKQQMWRLPLLLWT